jgi:alpha-N-acetylglucosamine transferase
MNLIYQVSIGENTKLSNFCMESVKAYAERIGADYIVQEKPILKIRPDEKRTDRVGKCGGWIKHGYMPIFEKENVFNYFNEYEKCCVIDSDIYIRPNVNKSIFDKIDDNDVVGSVYECSQPLTEEYARKINFYSVGCLYHRKDVEWEFYEKTGISFFNSGVMLYNSKKMLKYLDGMTPKEFLNQPMLKDFIDGIGPLKWQSDQLTLNYWFKKKNIEVKKLNWAWNGLFGAIDNESIKQAGFIHFFMKDNLPEKGENIETLKKIINGKRKLRFKHR